MDELKNFLGGGMDTDSIIENIAPNDYIKAFSLRVTGTSEGESGYCTNIESTEQIPGTRPLGINKGLGSKPFQTIRKALGFIYNSQGFHLIVELDYDTNTEEIIFTNKTDSNGIDILPLTPDFRIEDIKLINDQFLLFTGKGQVCYIDYNRLKNGDYGVLTADDFSLIKAQPLQIPTAQYINDGNRTINLISKKLFQFAYFNTYEGFEESTLSSYSKLPIPSTESTASEGTDVTKFSGILISVDAGNSRVKTITIAARYGGLDWFIIKSIDRSTVVSLTNTTVNTNLQIYEAYNPSTNQYSFVFYNDGLYNNLPVLYTDLTHDYVPLQAQTLEVANGVLLLGNITEGYDRPTPDVNFFVSSYDPQIKNPPPDNSDSLRFRLEGDVSGSGSNRYSRVEIYFNGLPKTGDQIIIITSNLNYVVYNSITYTVPALEEDNLLQVVKSIGALLPYPWNVGTFVGEDTVVLRFSLRKPTETPDGKLEVIKNVFVDLANTVSGNSTSIHALKSNSSYQVALAFYDKYGRPFPISTGNDYILKTLSYAQMKGYSPVINWSLSGTPPEDAASYQFCLSKNTTHQNNLYINGKLNTTLSTADYFIIDINPLFEFNQDNSSSILNYEYSDGDRSTFIFYGTDAETVTWFDNPVVDVEVVDFNIVVDTAPDPDETHYYLKVRKPSSVSSATIENKNILLEIYSPAKRAIDANGTLTYTSTVFYEIGEQFLITNGQYSVTSGSIKDGDVYFKTRELPRATNLNVNDSYVVEDFNFSDFYQSAYYSYGRARSYYDVTERINRKACIRYSDTFIFGSRVNGLTRFYKERIYGDVAGQSSSTFGGITKIHLRDNYLICLQEFKTGHIPVNLSLLEDQAEQTNVAISDNFLNNIRYAAGKWGIGLAKSSFAVAKNGDIYFVDPNNSLPIRDGANGVNPISFKKTKYFQRILQKAFSEGKNLVGWFDDFNEEYGIAIENEDDIVRSIVFSSANWKTQDDYSIIASSLSVSGTPTKGSVVINNITGKAIFTPTLDETGLGGFSFSFLNSLGQTLTKSVPITIIGGDTAPDPYLFNDIIGVSTSTLTESNSVLISGINIPTKISVVGGEYQINGGSWDTSDGLVNNGDIVKIRQTSSSSLTTTTNAILIVGSYFDVFSITTTADILVLDFDDIGSSDNVLLMIDTPGISITELAYTGSNFVLAADSGTPSTCYILASDFINQVSLNYRFVVNIKKFITNYPSINEFIFKLKGRAVVAGSFTGLYSFKYNSPTMIMSGSPGSYIPSHTGGSSTGNTAIGSTSIGSGADGTYNNTLPTLLTFTYNKTTGLVTIT